MLTRVAVFKESVAPGSGIVVPCQTGTNWSRFSDTTADVPAPLLAYEGLRAFFLEAWFLGALLFGRRLVPAANDNPASAGRAAAA